MTVQICLGTACYVQGSSDLLEELKSIQNELNFELTADVCIGACQIRNKIGMPPYVKINDRLISNATADAIGKIIRNFSAEQENGSN